MTNPADDIAIRNLTAKLAYLADQGDLQDYVSQFTEDAIWEIQSTITDRRIGRADILAGAKGRRESGSQGPGSRLYHVVTTQWIDVNGDTAQSGVYLFTMATGTAPAPKNMVCYDDTYRRTPQGWLLAKRSIRAL